MKRALPLTLIMAALGAFAAVPTHATTGNDDLATAIDINQLDYSATVATTGFGTEPGEDPLNCHPTGVGSTAWWTFTPAETVHVKANTYDTNYNTVMALYEAVGGTDFSNLVQIACNDQVATMKTSRITQILKGGHTYYFQVGGVAGATGTLHFRLKVRKWKVGITRGDDWYLNDLYDGSADVVFEYGNSSDAKLAGNWGGHGVDTPWVRRGNLWILNDWFDSGFAKQFGFGLSTDDPLVGDWNGTDEVLTPAVHRGIKWYFSNGLSGITDFTASYGNATDYPLVGDWDGDGDWTPGVRRGNTWYLSNDFDGDHDITAFGYGNASDWPVVGDWDGDGDMTPGVVRAGVWYLNNDFNTGHDIPAFAYGLKTDEPIVGDWNGIVE